MSGRASQQIICDIVRQHAEEASLLHETRSRLTTASHIRLGDLARTDERIAAHLDGLAVAGPMPQAVHDALIATPTAGSAFTLTTGALAEGNRERFETVLSRIGELPIRKGLVAALGWAGRNQLQGIVADLLASADPFRRVIGIAACAIHRVDPGLIAARRLEDPESLVRARALRTAGEIGIRELVSRLASMVDVEDPDCAFWAACAAVLLGDRNLARDALWTAGARTPMNRNALRLYLLSSTVEQGHACLQPFADDPLRVKHTVTGTGFVGDPKYVPWLISRMVDDKLARLAGESFSMITGLDLSRPPFFREQPPDFESGPTDNPDDENVEMDDEDDLPWPDQVRVQAWWNQNGARFTTGIRHFMGAPPGRAHCIDVLKNGYQRQRIAAAYHLCLLNPGTPLFEWRAPAWRQQRELAQMT